MSAQRVKNWEALYKFCVANNPDGLDASSNISEADQAWLREAMQSCQVDVISEIKKNMAVIGQFLQNQKSDRVNEEVVVIRGADSEACVEALENLCDYTLDIDFSRDFVKLGGLSLIEALLKLDFTNSHHHHPITAEEWGEVARAALSLFGNLMQNNETNQRIALEDGFLDFLIALFRGQSNSQRTNLAKQIVFAISCLVRNLKDTVFSFVRKHAGFDFLFDILIGARFSHPSPTNLQLKVKTAFFIQSLMPHYCVIRDEFGDYAEILRRLEDCVIQLFGVNENENDEKKPKPNCKLDELLRDEKFCEIVERLIASVKFVFEIDEFIRDNENKEEEAAADQETRKLAPEFASPRFVEFVAAKLRPALSAKKTQSGDEEEAMQAGEVRAQIAKLIDSPSLRAVFK